MWCNLRKTFTLWNCSVKLFCEFILIYMKWRGSFALLTAALLIIREYPQLNYISLFQLVLWKLWPFPWKRLLSCAMLIHLIACSIQLGWNMSFLCFSILAGILYFWNFFWIFNGGKFSTLERLFLKNRSLEMTKSN